MKIKKQTGKLPPSIKKEWEISKCLSINCDNETYLLQGITKKESNILKIFHRSSFSKKKYKKISPLTDCHLLLPKRHCYASGTHYLFYPKLTALKDILFQNGISLYELLSLGTDLTYAVECLLEYHVYEADISPNNVYLGTEGNFCLGDINLSCNYTKGTPGYIAPEFLNAKSCMPSRDSFDKAMQFSICRLIDSIYQLGDESTHGNDISHLLGKGMHTMPQCRFSSLRELREAFQKQQKFLQEDGHYQFFQIHEQNHILFRTKTLPIIPKQKPLLYPFLWSCLILSGCFFLITLYRSLHSDSLSPEQRGIYLAQVSDTGDASALPQTVQTFLPAATEKTTELNMQKKGFASLSPILSQTQHPEEIFILYAGENRITDISSIPRFSKVKELYFNNNCIQELSGISSLENLEILVLSYNRLTSLPDLSKLPSLKILDISSNPDFKDIKSLKKLTSLSTLNITGTDISHKQYRKLCKKLNTCKIIY